PEGSVATVQFLNPTDPSLTDRSVGLTFSYDFNNDNDFTDPGDILNSAFASAAVQAALTADGPTSFTVHGRISDKDGGFTDYTALVNVVTVAPTATFGNGGAVPEGGTGTVSFTNAFDPSAADTAAGFTYSYDFNNDGTFEITASSSSSATVPAAFLADGPATLTVKGRITDR